MTSRNNCDNIVNTMGVLTQAENQKEDILHVLEMLRV